ncbi:helix-turn-helix domain-containing protein [Puia sp. P3]|uniref:helix-turn-helix domain-containing protein n=1 Tax=Puia sp. P3 TaxID=3423952 RepID=UPI003D66C40B
MQDKMLLQLLLRLRHELQSPSGPGRLLYQSLGLCIAIHMKIHRAMQAIQNRNSSLTGIAYDFGFSDQSHFSRTFKKIAGISPRQYQDSEYSKIIQVPSPGSDNLVGSLNLPFYGPYSTIDIFVYRHPPQLQEEDDRSVYCDTTR